MARSRLFEPVKDRAGNVIAAARVNVFLAGTSTPVSDMYTSSSGGSPVTFLTSNSAGYVDGWFDTPKSVKLTVTDNSDTAYYVGDASRLVTFADISFDNIPVYSNPADDPLETSGSFAARPAAGTAGRFYFATDQGLFYRDNGTSWQRIVGAPNEIWVTDYGAVPSYSLPSAGVMTANVAAFDAAIAAARAGINDSTAPFAAASVAVPGILSGWRYWVNSPINFEQVEVYGIAGSIHGPGGEVNTRVWIDGSQIVAGRGTFEMQNIGVVTAGVAGNGSLRNLYITGNTNCVRNVGRAFLTIRDCDMYGYATTGNDRACLYLENCFWIRVERIGMTCAGGGVFGGSERCIQMVANNSSGDGQGISQAHFRHLVLNGGQVRFENRLSASGGTNSANVNFFDVVSESVGTQPFIDYVNMNSGAYGHDLASWTVEHCERADASSTGAAFLSMDNGSDSGGASVSTMKFVNIIGCQPYSQYWLRAMHRGGFQNVNIYGKQLGTSLLTTDASPVGSILRGIREYHEDGNITHSTQGSTPSGTMAVPVYAQKDPRDANYKYNHDINNVQWWGPGGATAPDTRVYRGAAGAMVVPMLVKAGVPSDADFVTAPPNGTLAINSSTPALYCRIGGVWTAL